MLGGGRQGLYAIWKYVDRVPELKGSGGTATIKCKLCNLGWKGTYTRVKAHFLHLPCNGIEGCPNECERYDVVREQERADGKVVMQSSHASTTGAATTTYSHDIESEVDVTSRGLATEPASKRPHIGNANLIGRLFDVQGREAVDAAIGRFFYANRISFNVARSPFYEEMVRAINNAPAGYKPPGYEKLRTTLVDKEKSLVAGKRTLDPWRAKPDTGSRIPCGSRHWMRFRLQETWAGVGKASPGVSRPKIIKKSENAKKN
ncbi:hypothetical protein SUGI_0004480 [Cryptomeria japonica]|nr:hypothetical protein SUGI_0004480 [Cryptomeria japonica]